MATVRKQTIGLRYTGSLYYATETINALNQVIVEGQDSIDVVDIGRSNYQFKISPLDCLKVSRLYVFF